MLKNQNNAINFEDISKISFKNLINSLICKKRCKYCYCQFSFKDINYYSDYSIKEKYFFKVDKKPKYLSLRKETRFLINTSNYYNSSPYIDFFRKILSKNGGGSRECGNTIVILLFCTKCFMDSFLEINLDYLKGMKNSRK
jgi:hypothetical protein